MAELVQLRLEDTIPELEQMERIGLFTRKEIKLIIRKRKANEYRLQRRHKTKEDYLKYINYEKNLLLLIKKRRENTRNFNKKKDIDNSIAKRISKLYKAAIVRCQKDVDLWLSHIDFCKTMHWNDTISGMFTRLLQVHNNNPELWIMAAKWEMEENDAFDNSRSLFQRGLNFHPESKSLWNEYFRMEMMFTEQIRKRNELAAIEKEDEKAILDGKIAKIVYSNAVEAIQDVNFAISFIPICETFEFAKSIEEQIYDDIKERYSDKEEMWDALAHRSLKRLEIEWKKALISSEMMTKLKEEVFSIYEDRLKENSTEKMWTLYIQMCLNLIKKFGEYLDKQIVLHILNLMETASNQNCLSEELFVERIRLLNSCCKTADSLSLASELVQKWPKNVSHWLLRLQLHIENESSTKLIISTFNESISDVPEKESLPLWILAVEWLSSSNTSKLKDLFEHGIVVCAEVCVPLKCLYLQFSAKNEGLKSCRKLYKRLNNMKPLSVEFYKIMIEIEYSFHKNPLIKRLRNIYEDGIFEFGSSSIELWLNYLDLELTHKEGTPTEVGKIYWRAIKTLEDEMTDLFLAKYALMSNNHIPVNIQ